MRFALLSLLLCLPFATGGGPRAEAAAKARGKTAPLVIAHRSASGYLPEHTLPGVAMAHAWGVDYVEPDVVLSKDDVPFVLHDIHLETTTDAPTRYPERKRADGRWYAVDFTASELDGLTVGERRDPATGKAVYPGRFPVGLATFRMPRLADYLALVRGLNQSTGRRVGVYLELKAPAFHASEKKDIAAVVMAELRAQGFDEADGRLVIQCFDPETLKRLKTEFRVAAPLVQLIGENSWGESAADYDAMRTPAGLDAVKAYASGIGPWLPHVLADQGQGKKPRVTPLVAQAHARGLVVHVYTARADDLPPFAKDFEALLDALRKDARVDGVFTDFGDRAVRHWARSR